MRSLSRWGTSGFFLILHFVSSQEHCDMEFVGALSTLNMNLNFLIAILVVLAVILTAVIVMAMYR